MGGKLSLILGGLLLATVAGSAFWIDRLQDSIGTLKGNQLILESKIAEQNEAIKNHLAKQKQTQNQLLFLEKEKQEAMRDVNRLRKTFAKHDLDELALAKPELMQSKINKASKRVLEALEKLTDPNQFDEEEDSDSS
jgi:biopolymer transport protein ExbB/TolQ|tara:strand:+ start:76 stop:486 length:411 start_codon:yes stop_codon:yes gene_type:complete